MPNSFSIHHLHALPGFLIAIREMIKFCWNYAVQTIPNAKTLVQALTEEGMWWSKNSVLLKATNWQRQNPSELRIGVQVMTQYGMQKSEIVELAAI